MIKKIERVVVLFVISLFLAFFPRPATATTQDASFRPGERLVFQLRWGFVPVGEATLEILPEEEINGVPAWHFVLTAKSNSFADVFYKVRDRVDSYVDRGLNHSILYKKDQQEGKTRRNVEVVFNWDENKADYSNFGKEQKTISLMPDTLDPLAAFYFLRQTPFQEGTEVTRPITDGKKNVIGRVRMQGRETLEINGRTYDTMLVEPDLQHVGGVFEKSKNAKIRLWLSADNPRLLVRLQSKVVVGSFVADLVAVEQKQ